MMHIGRLQRIDIAWLHERLGVHPMKDAAVIFYEDTSNMSADIYTKSFNVPASWEHALELVNIFNVTWLKSAVNITAWMNTRDTNGNAVRYDNPSANAKWSRSGRKGKE